MGTLSHLEKIGVFPSAVLGDPIYLLFDDDSVLQNSFSSAATARADSNATPFKITQVEALIADPLAQPHHLGISQATTRCRPIHQGHLFLA